MKKNNHFRKTPIFLTLFLCFILNSKFFAADYYWVGGAGNWSQISHWATTSGGSALHQVVPGPNDNVFFDANSGFTAGNNIVNVDVVANCNNMVWNNAPANPELTYTWPNPKDMNIFGFMQLQAGMSYKINNTYFKTALAAQPITINGATISQSGFIFEGAGGWVFQDNINAPNLGITFNQGTLSTNGKEINIGLFNSSSTQTRNLNIQNSKITVGSWTYQSIGSINSTASEIFVRSSFHADQQYNNITFTNSPSDQSASLGGNITANKIVFTDGGDISAGIGGVITANTVIFNKGKFTIGSGSKLKVLQSFTAKTSDCDNMIVINSFNAGSQANLELAAGCVIDVKGLMIQDINAVVPFTTVGSLDLGNNTNITFSSPAVPRTLYWVGGIGNWSDRNRWSTNNDGIYPSSSGGCIPTPNDNVVFNQNSGTYVRVNVDITANCRDMTWSSANSPGINGTGYMNIYGSFTLQPNMNYYSVQTFFKTSLTNQTITTAGNIIGNVGYPYYDKVIFDGSGEWILQDNFVTTQNAGWGISLLQGKLNTNGKAVITNRFVGGARKSSLILGSSVITITDFLFNFKGSETTLDAGTSEIIFTNGGAKFEGQDNHQYYNITFNKGGSLSLGSILANKVTFLGDGTLGYFVDNPQFYASNPKIDYLIFSAGKKYLLGSVTVNKKLTANGSLCNGSINISSYKEGLQATLDLTTGATTEVNGLMLQGIKATGSIPLIAPNSFDLGNNTNITFSANASKTLYWVGGAGNWNDKTHWSTVNNGVYPPADGGCIPSPNDHVIFNANSGFTTSGNTVSIDTESYCKNMTWIDAPATPKLVSSNYSNSLNIYGSLSLQSNMIYEAYWTNFKASQPENVITNNVKLKNVQFNGTGSWTFQDNVTSEFNYLIQGTLNTNNKNWTATEITKKEVTPFALSLGSSIINVNVWSFTGNNTTLDSGTSTITSSLFNGQDAHQYNNIIINGSEMRGAFQAKKVALNQDTTIYNAYYYYIGTYTYIGGGTGTINIDNLIFTAGKTYILNAGRNINVKELYTSGNPCRILFLKSSAPGTQANLNVLSGNTSFDYVNVKDINASGSYQSLNMAGHSTNAGNNTNITFAAPTTGGITGLGPDRTISPSGFPVTLTTEYFYPNPSTTYLWGNGSTSNSLLASQPGIYTIKVTYGDGCEVNGTLKVNTTPPVINCTRVADTAITGSGGFPNATVTVSIPSLNFTGTGVVNSSGNWSIDISSVRLVVGTSIIAYQTINSVQSESSTLLATPKGEPLAPSAASVQNFKPSVKPNPTVSDLVATGSNLKWYNVAVDGVELAGNTALQVGYYYVSQTVGICVSPRTAVFVTLNENPCGMPGVISYQSNKIVGCTKVGYKNLAETTEVTGISNPPLINGSFKYIISSGVVGREGDKFYKLENPAVTPVSTLPSQTAVIGKVVYDNATDHFYERTSAGWVQIDN